MTTVRLSDITKIADALTISRAVFEQAYDELARAYDSTAFKVIAQMEEMKKPINDLDKRNKRDFRAAMIKANTDGWLIEFVFEKFADLSTRDDDPLRPDLQSIANKKQRFQDPDKINLRSLRAMRQCCIIRSRTETQDDPDIDAHGSGFLIGPHLVLTNYHVISKFLDAEGQPDPSKGTPFVEFDYYADPSKFTKPRPFELIDPTDRSWLLEHSPFLSNDEAETIERLDTHLDFAILILDGRPGDARGFTDLSKLPAKAPEFGLPVHLLQFPRSGSMKVVTNNREHPPQHLGFGTNETNHARIYYTVNSLDGSSGGLVLNDAHQPVALHDAGFHKDAPDDARKNRGILLSRIAQRSLSLVTQEINTQPPKKGWHPSRRLPIIGRQHLQRLIYEAAHKDARIISVMTIADETGRIPKLGRSYTREIIESCLPATEHHLICIEASLIDPDPFMTARRIVSTIGPELATNLPAPTGETTLDADATGLLVDATVTALKNAAPGKTVWLMIDDIDADPIGTQWGASSYLVALYRRIAREARLRVVLAGLPRRLEGLEDLRSDDAGLILEDPLDAPPNAQELQDWMAAHLTHELKPNEIAPRLAHLVSAVAQDEVSRTNGGAANPSDRTQICPTEAANRLLSGHARSAFLDGGTDD